MARKRDTTEEIIRKLREAGVLIGRRQTVKDFIRRLALPQRSLKTNIPESKSVRGSSRG